MPSKLGERGVTMTKTQALASFAESLQLADVPQKARVAAKRAILDSLGCMLGGSRTKLAKRTGGVIETLGGNPQAVIVGSSRRTNVAQAAFLNAIQANALDYDDAFERDGKGMGHPGASVVPAALAMAEWLDLRGEDLLTAVIAGYEVCNRVVHALQPTPERHAQVWGVAVHQTFGAAVAAAKLAGLSGTAMLDAMGLAGATSNVPAARKWNWDKRPLATLKDVVAWPAETGVRAALLAQQGYVGSRDILDGDSGFWVMAGSDQCDFELLDADLGAHWTVTDLSFKPYPACRWIHAALEATEHLLETNDISPDDIDTIRVGSFADLVQNFADYAPKTMVDAEFSAPFTIAALAAGVPLGPDWYTEETLKDERVLALARKVHLEIDREADARHFSHERKTMSVVTITTVYGAEYTKRVEVARGGAGFPWEQADLEEKFCSLAAPVLGDRRTKAVLEHVADLEGVDNVRGLASLLAVDDANC